MRSLSLLVVLALAGCNCGGGGLSIPTGFSTLYPTADTSDGLMPSLVLDGNEHPMLAWMKRDAANPESWSVRFSRWDSKTGAWTTPVLVAGELGRLNSNPLRQGVWLARDPKDGRLGIAFMKTEQFCGPANGNKETTVNVTFSTDQGATWSVGERVSEARYTRNDPVNGVELCNTMQPRIAMKDGTVHMAWQADAAEPDGISFLNGYYYASSTAPGAWSRVLLPHAGDDARVAKIGVLSLALDSAGAPAVAYEMSPISLHPTPNMTAFLYVRPGSAPVRVTDSMNIQNDFPQLALGFDGTKPRIAGHLGRMASAGANTNWVFSSNDGMAWTTSPIPPDGEDDGARYIDVDFEAGKSVVVFEFGRASAMGTCGGPKLARSADGVTWTNCGVDTETRQFLGDYVTAELTKAGKLITVFREDTVDSKGRFQPGIVIYVEP